MQVPSNLGFLPGRHASGPRLPAHAPQSHGGGVLALLRGHVIELAGGDLGDKDGVAVSRPRGAFDLSVQLASVPNA